MDTTLDSVLAGGEAPLDGVVVAVTGAAGGIGSAVVRALHECGASVAACDLDVERTRSLASEYDDRVQDVHLDVTDERSVAAAIATVTGRFGPIDVLVNGAGLIHADPLLELPLATWRKVFSINVEGALLVSQAVAQTMIAAPVTDVARRGLIVNISSRGATMGRPYSAAYGASKAALDHLTMSMSVALQAEQISCVSVYPGDVREGMLSYLMPDLARVQGRSVGEVAGERNYQSPEDFASTLIDVVRAPGMSLTGSCVGADRSVTSLSRSEVQ
ncbi:SDR family oxidoreductase [Gordonia sp. LSe1-13]|uniref:SDR family oxidoreductase n=1 Tax=Gordonia sesuvii TaxID=3116777 RepID=A0ABU7M996_9ACTN|nr:SDR family oxidoreductase [Gordonia sp. LSe1-13]